ncbi:MAG: hypothetical protein V2B19_15015 [Pseudomonadota bacterium]
MKKSSSWNFKSIVGKMMMGLVLAAMIGSMDVGPALGRDHDDRRGKHDNGRYDKRDRGGDHRRYVDRGRRGYYQDLHGRRVYRYYNHRERIYVPPQPIYEPPPPFGIGIFFPPIIIHP